MKVQPWHIAFGAAAVTGLAIFASQKKSIPSVSSTTPAPPGGWKQRVWEYADIVAERTNWVGLPTYLLAVAKTESNGVATACAGDCEVNAARGWYGLRPTSALVGELGKGADILYNEKWSTGLAAWYAARLSDNGGPGQVLNWLALRRGWALPSLVSDVTEAEPRSVDVRLRFEKSLDSLGISRSFMYERAFPPGWSWPGDVYDVDSVRTILKDLGAL
jgi:hypothetical protein